MNNPYSKLDTKKEFLIGTLFFIQSGWQDSNLRPPRPKRGAITGLRYTPNNNAKVQQSFTSTRQCGETGIRTQGTLLGYAYLANKSFRPLRHLSFNELYYGRQK